MATDIRVVLVTVPAGEGDEQGKVGTLLAKTLVEERLAACVNRLPNVTSTYRWNEKIEVDAEELLLIKTSARHIDRLTERVRELHPNDLPEVIALTVGGGLEEYLTWVRQSTT